MDDVAHHVDVKFGWSRFSAFKSETSSPTDEQVASHHGVSMHSHETSSTFHITKDLSQETDGLCWGWVSPYFLAKPTLLKTNTLMVESCQFHSS